MVKQHYASPVVFFFSIRCACIPPRKVSTPRACHSFIHSITHCLFACKCYISQCCTECLVSSVKEINGTFLHRETRCLVSVFVLCHHNALSTAAQQGYLFVSVVLLSASFLLSLVRPLLHMSVTLRGRRRWPAIVPLGACKRAAQVPTKHFSQEGST